EERSASGQRVSRRPEREAVAAHVLERLRSDVEPPDELLQVIAEIGAVALPREHTDVEVCGLRKDPGVPAWERAELEHEPALGVGRIDRSVRDVGLEGDEMTTATGDSESTRRRPVDAVCADDRSGDGRLGAVPGDHPIGAQLDVGDADFVAENDPSIGRPGDEKRIEPLPLGHQYERPLASAEKTAAVAESELDLIDRRLDDSVQR